MVVVAAAAAAVAAGVLSATGGLAFTYSWMLFDFIRLEMSAVLWARRLAPARVYQGFGGMLYLSKYINVYDVLLHIWYFPQKENSDINSIL